MRVCLNKQYVGRETTDTTRREVVSRAGKGK